MPRGGRCDVDAEIRPGTGRWTGCQSGRLVSGEIVCLCGPVYRDEHALGQPDALHRRRGRVVPKRFDTISNARTVAPLCDATVRSSPPEQCDPCELGQWIWKSWLVPGAFLHGH